MSPPGKRLRHFEEGIDGSRTPGLGRWSPENMQVVGRRGWRCEQEERLRVLAPSSCPLHPSSGRGGLGERPCSGSKLPTSGGSEGSLSPGLRGTQDGLRRARGKLLCPCLGGGSEQPRAPLVLPSRVLLSWLLWRERGDEHCCSGNTVLQLQRHQLLPRGKYCGRDSWAYQSRSNSGRALGVPVFPGIARESPPCSTGHGLQPQPLWAGLGWAGSTVCSQFPPRLGCSRLTQDPPCCSGLLSGWECSAGLWTRELIRTPKDVRSLPSSELVIPVPHPPTRVPGSISQTKGDFQPESSPTMLPC